MNISKFTIVVGASAAGMNALSELVKHLKTGVRTAVFIVRMVAYSKGAAAGSRRKFTGIVVEWLYKLDEAGMIVAIKKI